MQNLQGKWTLAPKRAVVIVLALAALSAVAGCAQLDGYGDKKTFREWAREKPESQNYMRLPSR